METRANHVWVGAITLALLALLAAFFVWLVQLGGGATKEYDIFFPQSVGGLANGSAVTFQGVPAGQVETIELWRQDPSFVRVRVELSEDIPILQGTTASISASFTGVSTVSLGGAVKGAPPITEPGPEGVPVIPAEPGGLGEILASAPLLLERLATLTDRLTRLLSDENQASISGILANTDRMSGQMADMGPEFRAALVELKGTLAQSTETLDAFEGTLRSTDSLLNNEGQSLAREMRATMQSAQQAATALEATLQDARPAARELAETTLPLANATLQDLKRTSQALRQVTERIEAEGASSLVGGPKLPDYEP
jgi:phospholipid/cholesterol/gamma-HCH transport system substrate-binding protein